MSEKLSAEYPFFSALSNITTRQVSNFHALPIGNPRALKISKFRGLYRELLSNRLNTELTITAPFFDSLAYPNSVLAESQNLAANTFGSDQTLYVTTGSTTSNQIAVAACCSNGERIIVQKGLHQSFHFALVEQRQIPEYVDDIDICRNTGATALDLQRLLKKIKAAEKTDNPFQVVIINSQSYEGVIHKLDKILLQIASAGPSINTIIIDEAWGAWSVFDANLCEHTGLLAARKLRQTHSIDVVVTHSAHKSLFALRQASLLHCVGSNKLQNRLRDARYRLHTTSPSYAILTSLDLARAQMQNEGQKYSSRCIQLAEKLRLSISKELNSFSLIDMNISRACNTPLLLDPTKVWINTSDTKLSGEELRKILFKKFGIYTCRYTETALMVNIHYGVTNRDTRRLVNALHKIERDISSKSGIALKKSSISSEFIIPYPPGVPLVVPGDKITAAVISKLNEISASGVPLLHIEQR